MACTIATPIRIRGASLLGLVSTISIAGLLSPVVGFRTVRVWSEGLAQRSRLQQPMTQGMHLSMGDEQGAAATLETVQTLSKKVAELKEVISSIQHVRASKTAVVGSPVPASSPASIPAAPTAVPERTPTKKGQPALVGPSLGPTQDFISQAATLEVGMEQDPYWDMSTIPMHTFKAKEPYRGRVLSVESLVRPGAPGDVFHVKLSHDGKMPYWEGQSLGVTPDGVDANGKPHKVRLYSIASTRYGDDGDSRTVSLCVRRAVFVDPSTGKEDPTKEGVCSNMLCRARPGQGVTLTGPSGKIMLLPEKTPDADVIMIGTGTGIAPYRGFIRRLFMEDTPAARAFTGVAWLFLGVATQKALLYHDDWMSVVRRFPFNFRYDLALSREQKNAKGGKMYIQDKVEEYADEIFERLDAGAHIYFCGLKGMMPGINDMLSRVSAAKGISWDTMLKELKSKGQWHVEVY